MIIYYDKIHKTWIDLEVNNKVARFLNADRQRRRRARIEIAGHELTVPEYYENMLFIEEVENQVFLNE